LTIAGAMGGKQAIQELRRIEPDIKAIVSSGYSSDPVMENYEAYGFSGVLAKPFNLDSLRSVVENVLN
jgi:CheY-like chemotaxis protein